MRNFVYSFIEQTDLTPSCLTLFPIKKTFFILSSVYIDAKVVGEVIKFKNTLWIRDVCRQRVKMLLNFKYLICFDLFWMYLIAWFGFVWFDFFMLFCLVLIHLILIWFSLIWFCFVWFNFIGFRWFDLIWFFYSIWFWFVWFDFLFVCLFWFCLIWSGLILFICLIKWLF